jgi:hypothetical protein
MKPCLLLASTTVFAFVAQGLHAATLSTTFAAAPNSGSDTPYLLPSGANTDWGYWNRGNSNTSSQAATNTSSDPSGTRTFAVVPLNGGSVRGPGTPSSSSPFSFFNYTNGTTPDAPDGDTLASYRPSGVFNSQLGPSGINAQAGLQTTLSGFSTQSLISVWVFNFSAKGVFEVFINGTLNFTQEVEIPASNPSQGKAAYLFNLDFTPDSSGDEVNIRYRMTDRISTDDNAHVGFQAIAISPIPEPASLALLALGTGALGFRRRRSGNK